MRLRNFIVVLVSVGLLAGFGFSQSTPEGRPSLDRLLETVEAHWLAITNRDRQRASNDLLDESMKSVFVALNGLPMRSPKVLSIELTEPGRTVVTTQVEAIQPGQVFPLRFEQEWISQGEDWRLVFNEPESARVQFSSAGPAPESDANEVLVDSFVEAFTLRTAEIVIPEDAFGQTIEGEIAYAYEGAHTLDLDAAGPEQVAINRLDLRGIREGEGAIGYTVLGDLLFTNELPDVVLEVRSGSARAEYRVPVRWEGTPAYRFSWTPESVPPDYTGEVVLEIENVNDGLWKPKLTMITEPLSIVEAPVSPIGEGQRAAYRFELTDVLSSSPIVEFDLDVRMLSLALPIAWPSPGSSEDALRREIERLRRSVSTPALP